MLVAGRALTGTLAKEQRLLAVRVPSSGTTAGREPSLFWADVPGRSLVQKTFTGAVTAGEEHAVLLPSWLHAQLCPDLCPRGVEGTNTLAE